MVKRTFIEKCNTIFKDSEENFGLNPIGVLSYGKTVSRCLLWFDINKENFYTEGKHYLNLTNCGSVEPRIFDEMVMNPGDITPKERASSFDLLAFKIPEFWDAGKGFDKSTDFWLVGKSCVSTNGSNWYQAYNGKLWGTEIDESGTTIPREGVYDNEFLANEYKKFSRGEESIIITRQHFDAGNENINLDITSYIEDVLTGKCENNGIGLMFSPDLEISFPKNSQYYGFFTNNSNTFFLPVVESRYENLNIKDNRYTAYIGKVNKLYFYAILGGINKDLEEVPTCTIKGVEMPVFRQNKGVYFAEVNLDRNIAQDNEIIYDIWSNLKYNGEDLDDVELEFVAHKKENYFQLGEIINKTSNLVPSLTGINDNEKIYQGDERTVKVIFRIPYTSDYELVNNSWYRLYVKDGKREIDVIDWDNINIIGKENLFKINTSELVPNDYYIDIKACLGNDFRIFKNKLNFTIVDNITEIKK